MHIIHNIPLVLLSFLFLFFSCCLLSGDSECVTEQLLSLSGVTLVSGGGLCSLTPRVMVLGLRRLTRCWSKFLMSIGLVSSSKPIFSNCKGQRRSGE